MTLKEIDQTIRERIAEAESRYGPPASSHESLGVLMEEFRELESAIHQNAVESIRWEAMDIAAVAIRLASACNNPGFRKRSGCAS